MKMHPVFRITTLTTVALGLCSQAGGGPRVLAASPPTLLQSSGVEREKVNSESPKTLAPRAAANNKVARTAGQQIPEMRSLDHAIASPELIAALLADRWESVYTNATSKQDNPGVPEPISRFLAAHAALATNRDNEALVLFLSLQQPADQKACLEWTQQLADANPNQAVALYLTGDALARSGDLTGAETKLTSSLKADPKLALAWLARGVVRSLLSDADDSGEDQIEEACKLAPDLADAQASLGCLEVRQWNAAAAEEAFNNALKVNPRFALALNGRGCARYGSGVGTEQASLDFEAAQKLCPVLLCAESNQALVYTRIAQKVAEQIKLTSGAPGTSISASVSPEDREIAKNLQLIRLESDARRNNDAAQRNLENMKWTSGVSVWTSAAKATFDTVMQGIGLHQAWNEDAGKSPVAAARVGSANLSSKITSWAEEGSKLKGGVAVIAFGGALDTVSRMADNHMEVASQNQKSYVELASSMYKTAVELRQQMAEIHSAQQHPSSIGSPSVLPPTSLNFRPDSAPNLHDLAQAAFTAAVPRQTRPGGVTNKNLDLAFVDRGHWGVATIFTLAYLPPASKP